jgi:RNA-directed DNA polymerase
MGAIWETERRRVYFLQRWPSVRSMKRVRQKVRERITRSRLGVKDVQVIIRDLNPILRGWGQYFRTGNAAKKFVQIDTYAWKRLRRFMRQRKGRNLHAGEADAWTSDFFHGLGLHRLRGTVGASTMRPFERSPTSRVRETRTHGSSGGLAHLRGKSRTKRS